jgi:hypothetical protein
MSDKDHKDLSLNVDTIILPNEGKREVENWLASMGSFAGIPYQVQMSNGTKIDYYVDLTEQPIYKDYEVEVKIKRLKNQDNFYEQAQGTSFDYLAFTNKATFTYIDVPYIIVPQNQIEMGLTLSISLFVMVQTLETAIFKLQELATELVADLIPDTGVGVGAVIIVKVVDLIKDAVKLALQIAYVALLIIAIKKLADQLSELIFPKVRNFKACKVKELIEKSCISFGYTFKSTLLDSLDGLTVLPVPLIKSKYEPNKTENCLDVAVRWNYKKIVELLLLSKKFGEREIKEILGRMNINKEIQIMLRKYLNMIKSKNSCKCF